MKFTIQYYMLSLSETCPRVEKKILFKKKYINFTCFTLLGWCVATTIEITTTIEIIISIVVENEFQTKHHVATTIEITTTIEIIISIVVENKFQT